MTLSYPAVSTDNSAGAADRARPRKRRAQRNPARRLGIRRSRRTIRLLPAGTLFAPYKIYELWYEATGSRVIGVGFAAVRDLVSFLRYERADRDGTANPLIAATTRPRVRHHACARFRRVAERPVSAAFSRTRHERRRQWPARLRRRADPCRRRRQDLRQSQLRDAGPHRDAARGPALSGELVPVRQRRRRPTRFPASRRAAARPADRSADDRGQHLDRVLAEGRLAGSHRPGRRAATRHCRPAAGST